MSLSILDGSQPREMDIFVTLRHLRPDGNESESSNLFDIVQFPLTDLD